MKDKERRGSIFHFSVSPPHLVANGVDEDLRQKGMTLRGQRRRLSRVMMELFGMENVVKDKTSHHVLLSFQRRNPRKESTLYTDICLQFFPNAFPLSSLFGKGKKNE